MRRYFIAVLITLLFGSALACLAQTAAPVGDPALDPPTLRCLGFYWIVRDNDAQPATVGVKYRKSDTIAWKQGPPRFRTERGPF